MSKGALKAKIGIDEILERGIDAKEYEPKVKGKLYAATSNRHDYERILAMISLTGGEGVINSELNEQQALILSVMSAVTDPLNESGTRDETVSYDEPIIRTFVQNFKYNMISNKRKGRMEIVKVMRGEEEDETFTSRIKDAIKGDD